MSIIRCDDCGRSVDTDKEDFHAEPSLVGSSAFDRFYCVDCSEKEEVITPTPGNAVEQAEAALADLAGLAATFYGELAVRGVPDELAYNLTRDYMIGIFVGAAGGDK